MSDDILNQITLEVCALPLMEWKLYRILLRRWTKAEHDEKVLLCASILTDNKTVH